MDNFDFNRSVALKLYRRGKFVKSPLAKLIDAASYVFIVIWLFLLVYDVWPAGLKAVLSILAAVAFFWLWVSQYLQYSSRECIGAGNNLANYLDEDSVEYILAAQDLARKRGSDVLDMGIFWLALNYSGVGRYFLIRCGFTSLEEYSGLVSQYWQQTRAVEKWPSNLTIAVAKLARMKGGCVEAPDLIAELILSSQLWQSILQAKKLDTKDAMAILRWYKSHKRLTEKVPFWERETVEGVVGRDWSYGYTPNLLVYARDLSSNIGYQREIKIYGRENETKELERVLSKSDANNAILVGEQGVGKSTIVRALSQRIIEGKVGPALLHKHIWMLDTGRLTAGVTEGDTIETRLQAVLNEATTAGNIILFIDNIQNLLSHERAAGVVNAAAILLPFLRGRGLQIIGDTTIENYHRDIESNPEIAALFAKVEVNAPSKEDAVYVLEDTIPIYESQYNVVFTFQAVKEAVRASDRYIHDKPFPSKALEVVDDTAVAASQKGVKLITPELVDETISIKTNVPVGETTSTEKEKLLGLEDVLHKRVIGQNEAIVAVAAALKRARSGLRRENKPVGTFLFIGPTGVGKTETAKALAEAYFGSEKKIIRLDMSEYQNQDTVSRLIGAPPAAGGEGTQGVLTKAIKDDPFTVVLLDEIEKANPNILNLFLQVLDEGRLTDGTGRTVDFTNAIIIATSNAGAEEIRQSLQQNIPYEQFKKTLLDDLQKRNVFRPEFLNRFDAVVVYRPLTMDELMQIIDIMIAKVAGGLRERNITLEVTPAAKQKLVQLGYNQEYGARQLWRTVQTKLEDPLAEKLLRDEIPDNSTVRIDIEDIIS